jgi:hypothetical protein
MSYSFILKNINLNEINKKYELEIPIINNKTTNIKELNNKTPKIVSFLDDFKNVHNCNISIISDGVYSCFWCRHPFENIGIRCPINIINSQITKSYFSNITKTNLKIKQEVLETKLDTNDNVEIVNNSMYETYGIFCSFNCCKSWIIDHKHDYKYSNSNYLLMTIYNKLAPIKNFNEIIPAPSWEVLENYGGHLSIEKFRNNFNKIYYNDLGDINLPHFISIGTFFEEKIKL